MKGRCLNENNTNYHHYGGRGIKVCKEWMEFNNFMKDMCKDYLLHSEKCGEEKTTIERHNVDGDYCKENCKWETIEKQNRNKRNTIIIEVYGEKFNFDELSKKYGIKKRTLQDRYYSGWRGEKLVSKPKKYKNTNGG